MKLQYTMGKDEIPLKQLLQCCRIDSYNLALGSTLTHCHNMHLLGPLCNIQNNLNYSHSKLSGSCALYLVNNSTKRAIIDKNER